MINYTVIRTLFVFGSFLATFSAVSAQSAASVGVLTGRVVSTANGLPVIGVALTIAGRSAETDFNGVAAMNSA
jgi:hypothetical protein